MVKQCFECGTTEDLNEHHVVPRSRGGTKTIPLCYSCHCRAHGRDSKGLEHRRLVREGVKRAFERDPSLRARWGRSKDPSAPADLERGKIEAANRHEMKHSEYAASLRSQGISLPKIAQCLMAAKIPTPRGKAKWNPMGVKRLVERYQELTEET